jgi:hypothetical protein
VQLQVPGAISATLAAELRTRPPEIVRPEALDSDLLGRLLDNRPDSLVAQGLAPDLPPLPIRTKMLQVRNRFDRSR